MRHRKSPELDFSVYNEFMKAVREAEGVYFKTDKIEDLFAHIDALLRSEIDDQRP